MLAQLFNKILQYKLELFSVIVMLIAILGLTGWIFDIVSLTGGFREYKTIAILSCLLFILFSCSLLLFIRFKVSKLNIKISIGIQILILIVLIPLIIQYSLHRTYFIENSLIHLVVHFKNIGQGRISVITAFIFILSSFIAVAIFSEIKILKKIAGYLSGISFLFCFLLIMGYVYNTPFLYGGHFLPVSLPSATGFIFINLILIELSGINVLPLRVKNHSIVVIMMAKAFLPAVVLIIIFHGFIEVNITNITGNHAAGAFVLLLVTMLFLIFIISRISGKLGSTIDALQSEKLELEKQQKWELVKQNEEYYTLFEEYKSINDELNFKNDNLIILNNQLAFSQKTIKEGQKMLQDIVDNTPALVYSSDIDGKLIMVNKSMMKLWGKPKDCFIGQTWFDLLPSDAAYEHRNKELEVLEKRISINFEEKLIFNNKEYTFYSIIFPLKKYFNSNIHSICGISVDITDRKIMEQQLIDAKEKAEESDNLKTSFLQNMSHEIRTPMNAIMGFSELLPDSFNDKLKLNLYTQIINNRCADLLGIINDILDISKIESGQLPVNYEEVNLDRLFEDIKNLFIEYRKKFNKTNIDFLINYDSQTDKSIVLSDSIKLKQIFINLINNAFKFTESGIIEAGCYIDLQDQLVFFVSDTGIGIPEEKQRVIFDRFIQLNGDTKKLATGTGLGLSIAKGLVELLNGKIWLESAPQRGSKFYFSLPVKFITEVKSVKKTKVLENLKFDNKNVLIVEDDYYNYRYLLEILNSRGFVVKLAETGYDAIHIFKSGKFDVVLMDIRLPDINGYEASKELKRINPDIKIIAQTAYATPEDKRKILEGDFDGYISKPINTINLFKEIQSVLLNNIQI
jgi:PAS domain S-box-containing protein